VLITAGPENGPYKTFSSLSSDVMGPGKKEGSWNPLNSLEPPLYCISIIIIIIVFPKKLANKYTKKIQNF